MFAGSFPIVVEKSEAYLYVFGLTYNHETLIYPNNIHSHCSVSTNSARGTVTIIKLREDAIKLWFIFGYPILATYKHVNICHICYTERD